MNKILIIGLGLIGGSLAKAINKNKLAQEVHAFDVNIEEVESAIESDEVNKFAYLEDNLSSFDLIILATPLNCYENILQKISAQNLQNSLIIDVGSLKEFLIKKIPKNLENNFIACHPIAGSEISGFVGSDANLFLDKKFVICKNKNNSEKNIQKIVDFIKNIGAIPDFIDHKAHDEIYALTSHLPQFLSFLTKDFSPEKIENSFLENAFRLDKSGAEIWKDIFKINEKNLEKFYLEFFDNLEYFINKISNKKYHEIAAELHEIAKKHKKNDENFTATDLIENNKLLFRIIIVASYLKINKINSFQSYAGSGFKDFTSIISIAKLEVENLAKLIENSSKDILAFFKKISN